MTKLLRSMVPSVIVLALAACHADPERSATPGDEAARASNPGAAMGTSPARVGNPELHDLYGLALTSFDRGAYDDAAAQFAQALLRVAQDPSGDHLRHLLVQHIGWSLLGSYDVGGEIAKLDSGEAMLERYLVRHEQLLPEAAGEREVIYELLGEYTLRRDGEASPDANARLQALVLETHANLEGPTPTRRPSSEDRLVREIEVEAVPWAKLSDPRVRRFLRDPRYTGASLYEQPGEPFNPARVLVRGWVSKATLADRRSSFALLRAARPALEACYEDALGRGADIVERAQLRLEWDEDSLGDVALSDHSDLDEASSRCIVEALRSSQAGVGAGGGPEAEALAVLHLTFFIQPQRSPSRGDQDYDYFGPSRPLPGGDITVGAVPEDVQLAPTIYGGRSVVIPSQARSIP